MTKSNAEIIEKIRAMLNLARNSAAAEGEIANAMMFASRLMAQHQLSEADIEAGIDPEIELERAEMDRQYVNGGGKCSAWESSLAWYVCGFVGGVSWHRSGGMHRNAVGGAILDPNGRPMHGARYAFYGVAEDVTIATDLFADLRQTIIAMAKLRCGGVYRGDGRSYAEGFVSGLSDKLREGTREDQKIALALRDVGRTNALVVIEKRRSLVEKKQAKAKAWLGSIGVRLGNGSRIGGGQHHSNAYGQGKVDGSKHNTTVNRTRKLTDRR